MPINITVFSIDSSTLGIMCRYDPDTVKKIKTLPVRSWNPTHKRWEVPVSDWKKIKKLLPEAFFTRDAQKTIASFSTTKKDVVEIDVPLKTSRLFPFQKKGVGFLATKKGAILADSVGLGKTVQALAALYHLDLPSVLVVCPAPLKRKWKNDTKKFIGLEPVIIEGAPKERKEKWCLPSRVKIVNYELLLRDKDVMPKNWSVLILDEAQRIKNRRAKISKIVKMLSADYKWALSATPMENSPKDLYSILECISPGLFGKFYDFARNYCSYEMIWAGKQRGYIKVISGFTNLDDLHKKLQHIMLRRKKEEVLSDLPERLYKNYYLQLSNVEKDFHDTITRIAKEKFEEEGLLTSGAIAYLQMARMLCDSPHLVMLSESETANKIKSQIKIDIPDKIQGPKLEELRKIITDIDANGKNEKTVVFTQWARMAHLINDTLYRDGVKCLLITGEDEKKQEKIDKFRKDDSKVLISTDCLMYGVDLDMASYLIHYDLPWNPAKIEQREGRLDRVTQKNNMLIMKLIAQDTVEDRVIEILEKKTDLFKKTVEGVTTEKTVMINLMKTYT